MLEDDWFSFDRLKSFFFMSLCSWASDVDCSFVRCLLCIL